METDERPGLGDTDGEDTLGGEDGETVEGGESRGEGQKEGKEDEEEEALSMGWLVRRMSRIAATEVAKTAKVCLLFFICISLMSETPNNYLQEW